MLPHGAAGLVLALTTACRPAAPPAQAPDAAPLVRQPTAAGPLRPATPGRVTEGDTPAPDPARRVDPVLLDEVMTAVAALHGTLAKGSTAGLSTGARKIARAARRGVPSAADAAETLAAARDLTAAREGFRPLCDALWPPLRLDPNARARFFAMRCGPTGRLWIQARGVPRSPYGERVGESCIELPP